MMPWSNAAPKTVSGVPRSSVSLSVSAAFWLVVLAHGSGGCSATSDPAGGSVEEIAEPGVEAAAPLDDPGQRPPGEPTESENDPATPATTAMTSPERGAAGDDLERADGDDAATTETPTTSPEGDVEGSGEPEADDFSEDDDGMNEETEDVELEAARQLCAGALDDATAQYERFRDRYDSPAQIPRSATNAQTRLVSAADWTSGFPAGSFWYLFEHTGDPAWRDAAERRTAVLASELNRTVDHDIGFIINNSYGQGHRLTGRADYAGAVITAAQSLTTRFSATVGAIRSWDWGVWRHPVIIDNMMNLELLFHAAELGGDARFRDVAISHALTTLQNHFRPDASSYHVVDYDPNDGRVLARQTNQGLDDESAWARGQAWGLYGYTMTYRETEDPRFLEQALAIADFYTGHPSMPADGVPFFDFDAPLRDDVPDYRDASAGAIATSALLELHRYASGEAAARYRDFALNALRSLASPAYRSPPGANGEFLLRHAVGNYPINDEVDVGINYGDYYFLEALTRCKAL